MISMSKTACILFTHKINVTAIPLTLNGINFTYKKQVKFLGIIFNHRLNWKEHINYITTKCGKIINLLRSMTSMSWGASKKVLLTMYKVLIISLFEYGCQAYESATTATKQNLCIVQSKAAAVQ